METLDYVLRRRVEKPGEGLALTNPERACAVRHFHAGISNYEPTPLVSLSGLATHLGVKRIWVKDESARFGLNAFKALGGSWAMANVIAQKLGEPMEKLSFSALCEPSAKRAAGELTFVTATDGNHGRGVAWAARLLGQRAVVYLPKGSAAERLEHIRAQGAQAEMTDLNYDGAVRFASRMAEQHGWILVQDTAWPGYKRIPGWIMQGYTTMADEIVEQLSGERPTHLFLQAGVGSFAGAMLGYFTSLWGEARPMTWILEPEQANCNYLTAKADDGSIHTVSGPMNSVMAGLCCGEPCTLSWEILGRYADGFISCADAYSTRGMQMLGRPVEGDPVIVSGESGAVGAGVLAGICQEERLVSLKERMELGPDSSVLLISTEGDTDQSNYRRVLAEE